MPVALVPPVPMPANEEEDDVTISRSLMRDRKRARTIKHCMTHSPPCRTCEGCLAKARQKKHCKGTFDRGSTENAKTITMDQVAIHDLEHTTRYGGFKYGIVLCAMIFHLHSATVSWIERSTCGLFCSFATHTPLSPLM